MNKELNTNNIKKLIIGISIFFCTIILIIGVTTAFFTQSDSESTGNIVSTDKVTLDYQGNDDYMLGELIPINEKDLNKAYNNKCKDENGYNVCSIYQFTITNTGNVVQDIIINMHPKVNGFTNLKFNLYDITNNEQIIFNQELIINSEEPITLKNDLRLDTTNNKSNTYELVFYIKNDPNNDQSHLDAGVRFGANIEVNSVTTGFNVIKDLGDPGCWKADENDPTIISEFIGYTDKNRNEFFDEGDELKKECEYYFKKDTDNYYIVNIPSVYAGYNFKKIGNFLLTGFEFDENGEPSIPNEYNKIKTIIIDDEFTAIGEIGEDAFSPSLALIGMGIEDSNYKLEVNLPANLITIGNMSFANSALTSINIPNTVQIIGTYSFASNAQLTSLTFEEGSQLKEIGDYAFFEDGISNLILPSTLSVIGDHAFETNNITSDNSNPLIIPTSVTMIGQDAFLGNMKLSKLVFEGNNSDLTIGEWAFICGLDYQDKEDPLIIPSNIKSIGSNAFGKNSNGENKNLFYIQYKGTNADILNNTNGWYYSYSTTLLTSLDQMTED